MTTPPPGYAQPAYYGQPYQHPYPTDPADAPTPGISFGGALVNFFRKYAQFTGRASLSEYWWMFLWSAILGVVLSILMVAVLVPSIIGIAQSASFEDFRSSGPEASVAATQQQLWAMLGGLAGFWVFVVITIAISLALVVPHLALTVRRLHDSNKSGHFAWLYLVPSVGSLIVLILCVMPSEPWGQRYDRPLRGVTPGAPA